MQRDEKGRFVKEIIPWNKGLKGVNNSIANSTSFKAGKEHPRYRPIGSERVDRDGYIVIKINDRKWQLKHRYLWEKANRKIPKGHVVIFANGNNRDFSDENLILVSRKQLAQLNKNHLIKDDVDLTKTGIVIADLIMKINERKEGN